MKAIYITACCLLTLTGYAQRALTYEEACADIDYLFERINLIHPNMYWHAPKERMDSFANALKEKYRKQDKILVSQLASDLRQGNHLIDYHSTFNSTTANLEAEKVFPRVTFRDGKVYLHDTRKEIISINGQGIEPLRQAVLDVYAADFMPEYILTYVNHKLDFQVQLITHGIVPPYQVAYRENGQLHTEEIAAEDCKTLEAESDRFWEQFYPTEAYSFEIFSEASVAIIRFNRCVDVDGLPALRAFLDACFEKMEQEHIENLFIDVSRNGGGSTLSCDLFFEYIHYPKPCTYTLVEEMKEVKKNGKLHFKTHHWKWHYSAHDGFKGKVFIYQSAFTCSAAPWLGNQLRSFDLAILVGRETEAMANLYIESYLFRLPYSQLDGRVSIKHDIRQKPDKHLSPRGGLQPDIPYPFLANRLFGLEDCLKVIDEYEKKGKE